MALGLILSLLLFWQSSSCHHINSDMNKESDSIIKAPSFAYFSSPSSAAATKLINPELKRKMLVSIFSDTDAYLTLHSRSSGPASVDLPLAPYFTHELHRVSCCSDLVCDTRVSLWPHCQFQPSRKWLEGDWQHPIHPLLGGRLITWCQ